MTNSRLRRAIRDEKTFVEGHFYKGLLGQSAAAVAALRGKWREGKKRHELTGARGKDGASG